MILSSLSVEYVRAEVSADADPTSSGVSFAFTTSGDPVTWVPGEWAAPPVQVGDLYTATARVLVGPGQVTVPEGTVQVWVRLDASPEAVVKVAGSLRVS